MDERDPRTYAILGAAMEVHRVLGCGYSEPVYQEALEYEFRDRAIPFEAQSEVRIPYKQRILIQIFRPDFTCYGEVIVEIKALKELSGIEESQVLNYMKASGLETALLINFGNERLEWKRFKK